MRYFLPVVLLLLPLSLSADAGFAKGSLWTSRASITEGDAVTVYASLSNTADERITGNVIFVDGESELGTIALALEGGESRVVSISWKPAAGNHVLRASLTQSDGAELDRTSLSVFVNEKPQPVRDTEGGSSQAAAVTGSQDIQKTIADISPGLGGAVNPVMEKIDEVRESAVSFLDGHLESTKADIAQIATRKKELEDQKVLGAEAESAAQSEKRKLSIREIFSTLLLYVMEVIRFILSSAAIFYPLLVMLFLLALYKLYRRVRRPAYYGSDI